MTDSTLKSIEREDLEKSMLSRLSGEAADLFILLSAKDWNDGRPRIHSFARKLLADKDMMKAVNLVTSETREMERIRQQPRTDPVLEHGIRSN
jgi:hypothetical protein